MSTETISIRLDNLMAGTAMVPAGDRAAFLATLFVGADAFAQLIETPSAATVDEQVEGPTSFPLSVQQARELKSKIDPATWAVIKEAVSNVKDDVGTVEWSKVKELTGVANWTQFAKGRLGGLNRSLRRIEGVASDAQLLWEGDGWVSDDHGDYSNGLLGVDGPVVRTLRGVMGLQPIE